jgi:hypothetical protein
MGLTFFLFLVFKENFNQDKSNLGFLNTNNYNTNGIMIK